MDFSHVQIPHFPYTTLAICSDNQSEVLVHMKKYLQLLIAIRLSKVVFYGLDSKCIWDLLVLTQKATIFLLQKRFSRCLI